MYCPKCSSSYPNLCCLHQKHLKPDLPSSMKIQFPLWRSRSCMRGLNQLCEAEEITQEFPSRMYLGLSSHFTNPQPHLQECGTYHSLVYSVSIMGGHSVNIFVMPTAQIFFSTCPDTFWISGIIIFSNTIPNILRWH